MNMQSVRRNISDLKALAAVVEFNKLLNSSMDIQWEMQ
jgi:hypothetical protein